MSPIYKEVLGGKKKKSKPSRVTGKTDEQKTHKKRSKLFLNI